MILPSHSARAPRTARGEGREGSDQLVESNLRFVTRVALSYRNRGIPFEDLVNEGTLGLIEAARRFDSGRNVRFLTYAVWWIRKSILESISQRGRVVRLPQYQVDKFITSLDSENAQRIFSRSTSRSLPRSGEIHSTQDEIRMPRGVSLDSISSEEGRSLHHSLIAPSELRPDRLLMRQEAQDLVRDAMAHLRPHERMIVIHRFGLQGHSILTYKQLGRALGISHERVRQIEGGVKRRLRFLIESGQQKRSTRRCSRPQPPPSHRL